MLVSSGLLLGFGEIKLTGLPEQLNASFAQLGQGGSSSLIEGARPEAAANDEQRFLSRVEAKETERFGAVALGDFGPHGVAGYYQLLRGEELLHALVGHAYFTDALSQQLINQAGVGILFLNKRGDCARSGGQQHRGRGIATHAHHDIGPEFLD